MLTPEEEKLFWELYPRAMEQGLLDKGHVLYCEFCKKVFPLPEPEEQNEHWRWQKPSGKTKVGRFACKERDKKYRHIYNTTRRNTVEGYLVRKWDIVRRRCLHPTKTHMQYLGKLNMTKEEFYNWGNETLPEFIKKHNINNLYFAGVQLDRFNNDLPYQPDNLQWITVGEHRSKTNSETKKGKTFKYSRKINKNEEFSGIKDSDVPVLMQVKEQVPLNLYKEIFRYIKDTPDQIREVYPLEIVGAKKGEISLLSNSFLKEVHIYCTNLFEEHYIPLTNNKYLILKQKNNSN